MKKYDANEKSVLMIFGVRLVTSFVLVQIAGFCFFMKLFARTWPQDMDITSDSVTGTAILLVFCCVVATAVIHALAPERHPVTDGFPSSKLKLLQFIRSYWIWAWVATIACLLFWLV